MHPSRPRPSGSLCCAAAILLLAAGAARADIYGYVDDKGVSHFSDRRLTSRYYLYKRESPQVKTFPGSSLVIINVPSSAPRRAGGINPAYRKQFAPLVAAVAREQGLDPALLHAVVTVESGYNPRARSVKGAAGLMQLMPETARRYQVTDIWDPRQNLSGGARYLRDLLAMFNNNMSLALAAYNAGEQAVISYGNRIPPYPETRNYVPQVMQHYHLYAGR
jgi:soluble lytic murein transglycosylase-like protein